MVLQLLHYLLHHKTAGQGPFWGVSAATATPSDRDREIGYKLGTDSYRVPSIRDRTQVVLRKY